MIPHIRSCLKLYFPEKKHLLLNDFDRIMEDFSNHQQEIAQKFISIIRERLQFHLKDLKSLDWANESLPSPSYAVISLVKETSTLYRVISKLLPTDQVQSIFSNVVATVSTRFKELIPSFSNISNSTAQQRFS